MSFWNKVGNVARAAGEFATKEIENAKERSSEYLERMPELSDQKLAKIVLTEAKSSPLKVLAARKELRNRGYESLDDIKNI